MCADIFSVFCYHASTWMNQTLMKPSKEGDLVHQNNTTFAVVQCFYLLSPSDSNCPTNVSTSFFLLPSLRAFLDDDGLLK